MFGHGREPFTFDRAVSAKRRAAHGGAAVFLLVGLRILVGRSADPHGHRRAATWPTIRSCASLPACPRAGRSPSGRSRRGGWRRRADAQGTNPWPLSRIAISTWCRDSARDVGRGRMGMLDDVVQAFLDDAVDGDLVVRREHAVDVVDLAGQPDRGALGDPLDHRGDSGRQSELVQMRCGRRLKAMARTSSSACAAVAPISAS